MTEATYTRITVRASGKAHPAYRISDDRGPAFTWTRIACRCPGSANGRLANLSCTIAQGWEAANCGNEPPVLLAERAAR